MKRKKVKKKTKPPTTGYGRDTPE